MKSFSLISSFILFLASGISAQPGTLYFFPNLHFGLLECSNYLEQYGWPDVNHKGEPGEATWNLVGMFPEGEPRPGWPNPNSTWLYQLPQDGFPYKKYEGWNSSAFFWADPDQLKDYPRGWLDIHIPASAKGMKTEIQAGTITFEGSEFQCARQRMALFLGGGTECRETNREFCAGYTYCQLRYLCRRAVWPTDRSCVGSQANFCYPQWDLPSS